MPSLFTVHCEVIRIECSETCAYNAPGIVVGEDIAIKLCSVQCPVQCWCFMGEDTAAPVTEPCHCLICSLFGH